MKPVIRYQSQLLYRRSYKPTRPGRPMSIYFRPSRRVTVPLLANALALTAR